eukprot:PhF_6_TR20809/c0_g1_i2/m.29937/K07374/TUBA; tubulin alpha
MNSIQIHVGGCGIRIGDTFWQAALKEHGLTPEGVRSCTDETSMCNDVTSILFDETPSGKFIPRTMFVDTCPEDVDYLRRHSPLRSLYRSQALITGKENAMCSSSAER